LNDSTGVLVVVLTSLFITLLVAGGLASIVYGSRGNLLPETRRRLAGKVFLIAFVVVLAGSLAVVGSCVSSTSASR